MLGLEVFLLKKRQQNRPLRENWPILLYVYGRFPFYIGLIYVYLLCNIKTNL